MMPFTASHLLRTLTAVLVTVAFALLPMMEAAMADASHGGMHAVPGCSSELQPGMGQQNAMQDVGSAKSGECNQSPVQKANCCFGTSCPSVQMLESPSFAVPALGLALTIEPTATATSERGLHPAPTPRPPRLSI